MIQLLGRSYIRFLWSLVRVTKMSLTETYSIVQIGKNMSDRFPIRNGLKQGDTLSPMLFNFALEYAMWDTAGIARNHKLSITHITIY
jgi:hypothetical protein